MRPRTICMESSSALPLSNNYHQLENIQQFGLFINEYVPLLIFWREGQIKLSHGQFMLPHTSSSDWFVSAAVVPLLYHTLSSPAFSPLLQNYHTQLWQNFSHTAVTKITTHSYDKKFHRHLWQYELEDKAKRLYWWVRLWLVDLQGFNW